MRRVDMRTVTWERAGGQGIGMATVARGALDGAPIGQHKKAMQSTARKEAVNTRCGIIIPG
jgi:hypothetical protein